MREQLSVFQRSAPVLQVRDVLKSRNFYRDALGFRDTNVWGDPPCFAIVGRDTITVFLDQAPADTPIASNNLWGAYLYVDDVDALASEFNSAGTTLLRGPEDAPHGCREIEVRDPDGHVICFGQDLAPSANGPGL